MSRAPIKLKNKLKELVTGREDSISSSNILRTRTRQQDDGKIHSKAQIQSQVQAKPSLIPLPTSSSEERSPEKKDLNVQMTKPSKQAPGGSMAANHETPMGPHPAKRKESHKRPSSPAGHLAPTEAPASKRRMINPTPSKRHILFPQKTKQKDDNLTNVPTRPPPPARNPIKDQGLVNPKPAQNDHTLRQPTNSTNRALIEMLRSFRDDIVNQVGQQHVRTIEKLGEKVELLLSQNADITKKLNTIIKSICIHDPGKPPNISPTPPTQLPPFLKETQIFTSTGQPSAPKYPHPDAAELPPQDSNREHRPRDDDGKVVNELARNDEAMSIEQAASDSLPALRSLSPNAPIHLREPVQGTRHFSWMKKQFEKCFGLSTEMYKRREIYSFDGVKIAEGFNKVVATWQGLYYELKGEDIAFENLDRSFNTARGITTWSTKGVQVFKLHREDLRTTPRPHRFAVVPEGNFSSPCNPLKVGRFYVHVYQTKLKLAPNFTKTLSSKAIARTLKEMYGIRYLPRPRDFQEEADQQNNNYQENLSPLQNQRQLQYPHIQHQQNTSQGRRRTQTNEASFAHTFPLAWNPPPLPIKPQDTNWTVANQYQIPVNYVPAPPMKNQYQQLQYPQPHLPQHQRSYNPLWPLAYQNPAIPYPMQGHQHPNNVQWSSVPSQPQNHPQEPPMRYQNQQPTRQQSSFMPQPPGANRNYN